MLDSKNPKTSTIKILIISSLFLWSSPLQGGLCIWGQLSSPIPKSHIQWTLAAAGGWCLSVLINLLLILDLICILHEYVCMWAARMRLCGGWMEEDGTRVREFFRAWLWPLLFKLSLRISMQRNPILYMYRYKFHSIKIVSSTKRVCDMYLKTMI